jgi:hypothetical protein
MFVKDYYTKGEKTTYVLVYAALSVLIAVFFIQNNIEVMSQLMPGNGGKLSAIFEIGGVIAILYAIRKQESKFKFIFFGLIGLAACAVTLFATATKISDGLSEINREAVMASDKYTEAKARVARLEAKQEQYASSGAVNVEELKAQIAQKGSEFWNKQYSSEYTYAEVMDQNGNPLNDKYGGGKMKKAAGQLKLALDAHKAEIRALQAQVAASAEYAGATAVLDIARQELLAIERGDAANVSEKLTMLNKIAGWRGTSVESVRYDIAIYASVLLLLLSVMFMVLAEVVEHAPESKEEFLTGVKQPGGEGGMFSAIAGFISNMMDKRAAFKRESAALDAQKKTADFGHDDNTPDPVPPRPTTRKEPAKAPASAQSSVLGGGFSATPAPVVASAGVTAYGGSYDAAQYPVQGATAVAIDFGDIEPAQRKADVISFLDRAAKRDFTMPADVVASAHQTASVSDAIANLSKSWDDVTAKGFGHPGLDEHGRIIENCNDWTCKFRYRMVVLGEKASTAQEAFKCNDGHISRYGTKKIQPEIESGKWDNFKLEGAINA